MLKQFFCNWVRLAQHPADLMFLTSTLLLEGPRYYYNLTVSASFRVSLLFAGQHLCQGQGTCTQSETLVHINSPIVTKKWLVAILTIMAQKHCEVIVLDAIAMLATT